MTIKEFLDAGVAISTEAGILNGVHAYLIEEYPRIHRSCNLFNLFDQKLGRVLEIGPFYAYTPFVLRRNADSYVVIEGDDPVVYPLKPLYEKRRIELKLLDLFDLFGGGSDAAHRLPFNNEEFDTIICWETMEHFNFNPVKFVRELHRVIKPGGKACITVPNKASLERHIALLTGYRDTSVIDAYFRFEDYICNGRKTFLGFHWREYSRKELTRLFTGVGFEICKAGTFTEFQTRAHLTLARRVARGVIRSMNRVFPSSGANVFLMAGRSSLPARPETPLR